MKSHSKPFKYDLGQVVRQRGATLPGTVIARADRLCGEPLYLVRECESESQTDGTSYPESALKPF